MRWTSLLLASAASSFAAMASASDPSNQQANIAAEKLDNAKEVVGAGGPLDRAGAAISGSTFQFDSIKGDTEASLALTFNLDRYEPVPSRNADEYRLSDLQLVVKATVPVDDESGSGSFLSGDHIVTGSRVSLSLTRSVGILRFGTSTRAAEMKVFRLCVSKSVSQWSDSNNGSTAAVTEYTAKLQSMGEETDPGAYLNFLRLDASNGLSQDGRKLAQAVAEACTGKSADALAAELDNTGALREEVSGVLFADKPLRFMGIDASFGRNGFKALNRTNFSVEDANRNSWEVGAYYGLIGSDVDWSLRARAVYGVSYKSPDEVQLCRIVAGQVEQECIEGPDGLPQKTKTGLISLEGRKILSLSENRSFALAPQLTYDIEDDSFRAELPVYLSPDKDGKLTGGIKFAYNSKDDEFGVGLFVGVPFSVFFGS